MSRICLALPTNRACVPTLAQIAAEARYAAQQFGVKVHLLVLDSAAPAARAAHAAALRELPAVPGVVVHHLDEDAQRAFLQAVIERSGVAKPELVLDLMLPDAVSYGACTNRAFLIAAALGCESVHRRDSDLHYQLLDGAPVLPIGQELAVLGRRAAEAAHAVTVNALDEARADRPVVLAGASFIGELSVDIGEIKQLDPQVYQDVVRLWAADHWTEEEKQQLVEESFRGAGTEPFRADHSVLDVIDMWRLDMCNISLHRQVYERVPLLPARDTIGSDYFLIHLVYDAKLPGVVHNRHIVNFYTSERRTDAGFQAYQLRFAKFQLSMLYLHHIYRRMGELGSGVGGELGGGLGGQLLDERLLVRPALVAGLARESAGLDRAENRHRLAVLGASYRRLGGRYAEFAELLASSGERLLDEAQADIEEFALLTELWGQLVAAARAVGLDRVARHEA
ncbi:hypothetical protein E6W39_16160 [Kitasatospora acidiphila]|uniref:Uncharacterized protein n=1 Tax=Kitasatospora acidiphila TaxID=2567942 RepID=A0A540WEB2_9ACTN|nr:DUF6271 family protein [Kitasatospora acidiphila]TQF07380.1 hypothetical protein E6W39_16160 [Kitasatospora acidiphila]